MTSRAPILAWEATSAHKNCHSRQLLLRDLFNLLPSTIISTNTTSAQLRNLLPIDGREIQILSSKSFSFLVAFLWSSAGSSSRGCQGHPSGLPTSFQLYSNLCTTTRSLTATKESISNLKDAPQRPCEVTADQSRIHLASCSFGCEHASQLLEHGFNHQHVVGTMK
jgi:hypothetical protein